MDRSLNKNYEFIVKYKDGSSKLADINAESFANACLRFYKRDRSKIDIIEFKLITD